MEIILLNNKKYFPLKKMEIKNILYYVLININDTNDICVRKELIEDGVSFISMLDNENELKMVLAEYKKEVENK